MGATHLSGLSLGQLGNVKGTNLTYSEKGTVSLTQSALAAGAEEDLSGTVANAAVGDMVIVTPRDATAETGLAVVAAWVSAAGTIKVRTSNLNAVTALTSGAKTWDYMLIRS